MNHTQLNPDPARTTATLPPPPRPFHTAITWDGSRFHAVLSFPLWQRIAMFLIALSLLALCGSALYVTWPKLAGFSPFLPRWIPATILATVFLMPASVVPLLFYAAWQRREILLADGQLLVRVRTLRTRTWTLPSADILAVHAARRPFRSVLTILGRTHACIFLGTPSETIWLADALRAVLRLPAAHDTAWPSPHSRLIPPATSFTTWPAEVQVEPAGTRILLPLTTAADPHTLRRYLAGAAVRFVLMILAVTACVWVSPILRPLLSKLGDVTLAFVAPLIAMFVAFAWPPLIQAAAIARQRWWLELSAGKLIIHADRYLGGFRQTRRAADLRRLIIRPVLHMNADAANCTTLPGDLARLDADFAGAPSACLAEFYPRPLLLAFASALRARLSQDAAQAPPTAPTIEIWDDPCPQLSRVELTTRVDPTSLTICHAQTIAPLDSDDSTEAAVVIQRHRRPTQPYSQQRWLIALATLATTIAITALAAAFIPFSLLTLALLGIFSFLGLLMLVSACVAPALMRADNKLDHEIVATARGLSVRGRPQIAFWPWQEIAALYVHNLVPQNSAPSRLTATLLRPDGKTADLTALTSPAQTLQIIAEISLAAAQFGHTHLPDPHRAANHWQTLRDRLPPPPSGYDLTTDPTCGGLKIDLDPHRAAATFLGALGGGFLTYLTTLTVLIRVVGHNPDNEFVSLIAIVLGALLALPLLLSLIPIRVEFNVGALLCGHLDDKTKIALHQIRTVTVRPRPRPALRRSCTPTGWGCITRGPVSDLIVTLPDGSERTLLRRECPDIAEWFAALVRTAVKTPSPPSR